MNSIQMRPNPREAALNILNEVDKGRRTLDAVITDFAQHQKFSDRRDQALFNALVYGVLRWRGRLDYLIGYFSRTPFHRINPEVLNLLRLGLFQVIYLDRIPAPAAVTTTVEIAKSRAAPWVIKYVNAVLRRATAEYRNVQFPDPSEQPCTALAASKSFPKWLLKRWLDRYTYTRVETMCDGVNSIPPITIRTNTLKITPAKLVESLAAETDHATRTTYATEGISLVSPKAPIAELETFKQGWFQVQDEAAQLVSLLLNPKPGETVVDACAGLGGKTGHIAQLMDNSGKVIAVDREDKKLKSLQTEMLRLGISNVSCITHDLLKPSAPIDLGAIDRVLLDAPCSGLGVLRRNPDTKWAALDKKLGRFQNRQISLLQIVSGFVKPTGVLVYTVCSCEPEENEAVIAAFLKNCPEFVIEKCTANLSPKARILVDTNGYFRTVPVMDQMDGFFAVRLRKKT